VLRYVDRWACREGTPEDVEDERRASLVDQNENGGSVGAGMDDVGDVEKGERDGSGNSSGVQVDEGAHGVKR
jgi:hypothetical protein